MKYGFLSDEEPYRAFHVSIVAACVPSPCGCGKYMLFSEQKETAEFKLLKPADYTDLNACLGGRMGACLKIEINVDEKISDTQIVISCKKLTPEMERLLAMLHILDKQLVVKKGEETCFLDVSEVVYIESVDRKSFIYTKKDVYEADFRLYELEQQLEDCGFFRASKSCLVQLKYIKSLRADINRRIRVTLENGEQIIVSRQYAEELKRKLGLKS